MILQTVLKNRSHHITPSLIKSYWLYMFQIFSFTTKLWRSLSISFPLYSFSFIFMYDLTSTFSLNKCNTCYSSFPLADYSILHQFSSAWFIHIYKSFCLSALTLTHFIPFSQFSSVAQSCLTLCDPMNCSMPGLPVHHQLLKFTQTHVHCIGDTIQPFHHLLSPSPPTFNLSQHQGLFKRVSFLH